MRVCCFIRSFVPSFPSSFRVTKIIRGYREIKKERERERDREDRRVSKIEEKEAQEKGARRGGITGKKIVCGRSSQLIKLKHKRKCKQSTINIDRSIEEEKKVGFGGEP